MEAASTLERLLAEGRFVVCGEMSPPKTPDKGALLAKVPHFRGYVDAVNLTDNQSASVRMGSLMCSAFLVEAGLEPILQCTCRDRNRIALQSEILSAHAAGVRNVLCLSGDHPKFGDHPEARGVWDLDSSQLVQMAAGMSAGRFLNGKAIDPAPRMFVGAAAHPNGEPFEMRVLSVLKKVEAGARFFQTQPVFDLPRFESWMSALAEAGLEGRAAIIAGVMPIRSVKALQHMADVPGLRIPREVAERIASAEDPAKEGLALCVETIERIREIPGVAGVHIMPAMRESATPEIVERAGLLPRPTAVESSSKAGGS